MKMAVARNLLVQTVHIERVNTPQSPLISTQDNQLLCPNKSAKLSATFNTEANIMWYKQGSEMVLARTPDYTTSQPGTYFAIAAVNGCNSAPSTTITLTSMGLPDMPEVSGITSLCVGQITQLLASVPGGIWKSSNTNILTVSQSGVISAVNVGTSTVSYAVSNTCGVSTKNITVQVNALPSLAVITGASSICRGTSVTYKSSVWGGVWSSSNAGIISVNPSTGLVTALADGDAELRYTVTNVSGCKSTSTFNIRVITCALKGGMITPAEVSIVAGALPGSFCYNRCKWW